jgi:hypothetical protein
VSRSVPGAALLDPEGIESRSLKFSLGFDSLYDSNVLNSSGLDGREIESDLRLSPKLAATFNRGSLFKVRGAVNVSNDEYLDHPALNSTNYSLSGASGYESDKFTAELSLAHSRDSGINRRTSSFLETLSSSLGFDTRYRLSSKTSVSADWDYRESDSLTVGFSDTTSRNYSTKALWAVTPLTELGPGYRWGSRTGYNNSELNVEGPNLSLNYRLSSKVKLRSRFGVDQSSSSFNVGEDTLLNWALSLDYKASALWGLQLTAVKDIQASLSTSGGFDEVSAIRLTHLRKLLGAKLRLTVGFESRNAVDTLGNVGNEFREYDFFETRCSFEMPVYSDKADLELSVAHRELTSDLRRSWDGWQAGLGLTWRF